MLYTDMMWRPAQCAISYSVICLPRMPMPKGRKQGYRNFTLRSDLYAPIPNCFCWRTSGLISYATCRDGPSLRSLGPIFGTPDAHHTGPRVPKHGTGSCCQGFSPVGCFDSYPFSTQSIFLTISLETRFDEGSSLLYVCEHSARFRISAQQLVPGSHSGHCFVQCFFSTCFFAAVSPNSFTACGDLPCRASERTRSPWRRSRVHHKPTGSLPPLPRPNALDVVPSDPKHATTCVFMALCVIYSAAPRIQEISVGALRRSNETRIPYAAHQFW